ncbi:hypothetical protein R5R35_010429 [Gryllus longicercus]|uniref:Fatty acid desaturase domain-containing protein n=1 Tax=Gryllus longicercus TaxID=2509291 RepID=A0AAN9Z8G1_9ORTH
MAPNIVEASLVLDDNSNIREEPKVPTSHRARRRSSHGKRQRPSRARQIVWRNVLAFVYLHTTAVYGFYLLGTAAQWRTVLFTLVYAHLAGLGITAGAHRLWAHRSYKATWPLRFFLMICQTIAFQNHIYEWVRDHRVHHKYTDTDADPHNSRRGFFFSHMGWLMLRKHPHVREHGQKLDMSDLEADSIVMWQRRYYIPLMVMWCFGIPSWIPSFFWGEQLYVAYYVTLARYTFQLHATWLVNSAAHIWGMRPYDKNISPTQNLGVAIVSLGEGWHNYHHVFPWDYKTAELGNYGTNMTAGFIDCCAKLGLAYNLKSVTNEYIRRKAQRSGDGSHTHGGVWGWGDKDTSKEDIAAVHISHHKES